MPQATNPLNHPRRLLRLLSWQREVNLGKLGVWIVRFPLRLRQQPTAPQLIQSWSPLSPRGRVIAPLEEER